jgi:hypothetical protein
MYKRPLLPLPDYQRIYQVAYSVLEASGIARTHRACIFFATVGALILRKHYQREATISVGSLALMVDEEKAAVVVYGREENGEWTYDADGFHAWVECDGWLIDFMAPIMGESVREDGANFDVPRRMLQKPLADGQPELHAIQHEGEFFCHSDSAVAEAVLDNQSVQFKDLLDVCLAWFRRPPKPMPTIALGSTGTKPISLVLKAPAIQGVW